MGIQDLKEVEEEAKATINFNGLKDIEKPFLKQVDHDGDVGSVGMVLFTTFVAVCGSFEFGCCVAYSAPTQSAIRKDLNFSLAEYSMFGSILTIGAMVGAITSGRISDSIGRKWTMRLSSFFCIAGWLSIFFSTETLLLYTGRFFTGVGIGLFSYVIPIYIAEIAPTKLRGGLTTVNQLMIVTGASFTCLAGSVVSWRILALVGLVPCMALLFGLFFVPESPRWLASVGREEEFRAALRQLRGRNADVTQEASEIEESIVIMQALPKAKLMHLFQSRYIRALTIGVGLMLFQQFGGSNGIGFYVSETFVEAGLSSGKVGTIAYASIQVPLTILGALLIDKSGRRPLVMISATGAFIGCFLTATGFLLKSYGSLLGLVPFLCVGGVMIYISTFSIGMGAVPSVIMSEIFPTEVKGVAGSVVVLVSWTGAWLVSYTFNFMMSWSHAGTFYIYAVSCVLTVLFVAKVMPETKGKTLEEIQACLNPKQDTLE